MTSVKKTVIVAEILADIKRDMSDEELMAKYRLSEDGLRRLFDELLGAVSTGSPEVRVNFEE